MAHDWIEILNVAKGKRKAMGFASGGAFRLFDGAGDGAPGVILDEFGGRRLVQTPGPLPDGLEAALFSDGQPCWWKHLDHNEKDSPVWIGGGDPGEDPFPITENRLEFEISFRSGYSHGIFLDQRDNRARVRRASAPGTAVLNLFAYTCAFSVAAAAGGAVTSSVDLSGAYLDWGRRNFARNGLDPAAHFFTKGDALEWLGVFAKKGRTFDGIILDPPTFSRAKGRGVWRVEADFQALVTAAAGVLAPGGWMLCSTNCRRLAEWRFDEQIHAGFDDAGKSCTVEWGAMPPDFTGEAYLLNAWCRGD